eukprot:3148309-Ditylum_brightwellii.AAC.1
MFGVGTKPINKKDLYTVYAMLPQHTTALFNTTTTMGSPIPVEHFGARCILICKPKTDNAMKDFLTQYKLAVEDPCSMWVGIRLCNLKLLSLKMIAMLLQMWMMWLH